MCPITYPIVLDLPFEIDGSVSQERYSLQAVIYHEGEAASSGHYVTYARRFHETAKGKGKGKGQGKGQGKAESKGRGKGQGQNKFIVAPDGKVVVWGSSGPWVNETGMISFGSGGDVAMGAMLAGASAIEAVEAAIKIDVHSGGPVRSLTL